MTTDWTNFVSNYLQEQKWQQRYGDYGKLPWYRYLMGEQFQPWQPPQVGGGKYKRTIPLPSAQAWSNMAPSEREGYWGMAGPYADDVAWYLQKLWPSWSMPSYPRFNKYWW